MPGGPVVPEVSATIEKISGRYPTEAHLFSVYLSVCLSLDEVSSPGLSQMRFVAWDYRNAPEDLIYAELEIKPRDFCMLGKHSTD